MVSLFFRHVVLLILLYLGSKGTNFSDLEIFAASVYKFLFMNLYDVFPDPLIAELVVGH
jgi:hypothetical protein